MKAAFLRQGGSFEVCDTPIPEPGPGHVLVKVSYCGICGSDVHLVEAGMLPLDCILGHEQSGVIAKVGEGVVNVKEGDRVAVMPLDPCMTCGPCRAGDTQLCSEGMSRNYGLGLLPGGFAEYMLAKPSMLFKIPDGLDMATAAINEPWAVAVHGVHMLPLTQDSVVLVMGAGPIGLLTVFALKRAGAKRIYVSEPDLYRAQKASQAGAAKVMNPKKENPAALLPSEEGQAPDIVIDCAGLEDSTQDASATVGPKGTVLVLGVHLGTISLFPLLCFGKEVRLIFSLGYQQKEFGECLEMLAKGAVVPDLVISDVLPLSEITDAFHLLKESGHTKVLVDCQA
jgi:threonine dehydrogenase-like Zn-dependent dehydrogenase